MTPTRLNVFGLRKLRRALCFLTNVKLGVTVLAALKLRAELTNKKVKKNVKINENFSDWFSRLVDFNDRLSALSNPDPLHRHIQILLNKTHVVLSSFWQIAEVSNIDGRLLPSRQGRVLNFHLSQIRNGSWEVVDDFAVELVAKKKNIRISDWSIRHFNDVSLHGNFDLFKFIKNVQLREANSRISIDQRGVTQDGHVQPSAATDASSGHSDFSPAFL